jgi:MFS family permease
VIGLTFAGGALAIPITAALARRITRALGLGRTILAATVLDVLASLVVPAAPMDSPVPWLVAAFFSLNVGIVLYNVNQVSLRQAITSGPVLGRMNATMRFLVWGTLPLGSLIGGALGSAIGLRPTLWVGALGTGLAVVPIAWSPVRRLVDIRSATREWGPPAVSPPGGAGTEGDVDPDRLRELVEERRRLRAELARLAGPLSTEAGDAEDDRRREDLRARIRALDTIIAGEAITTVAPPDDPGTDR